jgi:cytochrome P450
LSDARDLDRRVSEFERGFGTATRLTSFSDVDEVFRSRDFEQGSHKHGHPSAILFNGSVNTVEGPEHFARRRLEGALLRKQHLFRLENEVLPRALERQFDKVRLERVQDGVARVDLLKILRGALIPFAAAFVGLDGLESDESIENLRLCLLKISEGSSIRWGVRPVEEVMPAVLEAKEAFVRDYFKPAWSRRRALLANVASGHGDRSELPTDLVTLLLTNPIAGWDADVSVREVLLFFTGAANTPALVAPHIVRDLLDWLAMHPEDQSLISGSSGEEFLWHSMIESLRLHLEVPAHFRRALRPVSLSSGLHLETGEAIALDIVAASRDPAVFGSDADHFNPHRPSPSRGMAFGFAFGGGPHTCIGRELMVGPAAGDVFHPGASRGVLGKLLMELFKHGIRLDPEQEPQLSPDRTRPEYTEFAVIFDRP